MVQDDLWLGHGFEYDRPVIRRSKFGNHDVMLYGIRNSAKCPDDIRKRRGYSRDVKMAR